ncbi:hypothetical protein D3C80_1320980 [compost metagenome]
MVVFQPELAEACQYAVADPGGACFLPAFVQNLAESPDAGCQSVVFQPGVAWRFVQVIHPLLAGESSPVCRIQAQCGQRAREKPVLAVAVFRDEQHHGERCSPGTLSGHILSPSFAQASAPSDAYATDRLLPVGCPLPPRHGCVAWPPHR